MDVGQKIVNGNKDYHPWSPGSILTHGCGSKPMVPFWGVFGAPPILEPILVGIESDVHWGYDSDFDPWPLKTWVDEG